MRWQETRRQCWRAVGLGIGAWPAAVLAASVAVTPLTAPLGPLGIQQFKATINGAASSAVTWMVNGIPGGAPMIGTISPSGLYTAPADVPAALMVAIEAEAQATPLDHGSASARISTSRATGGTSYVAPTGDDAGPGTHAQPWLTIQHAVDTVPAGGTVLVESGTYNELVTITRSGDARAGFITISAALGATPIVDGTKKGIPNQENGLFTLVNVSFVRINGFEVRNYITSQIALEPIGIYIIGRGSHIEITNNRVHNIANTAKSQQANALGIAVYGQSVIQPLSGIVIDHNEVFDLTLDFSESVALSGNVQGFQVTNNQIHDNNNIAIDMAGDEHYVTPYALDHARNGYVAGNLIYNISSRSNPAYNSLGADGIYVDAAQSIVIERNLVHNCDIGIEVASEHQINHQPLFGQNVFVRDNIVYASNLAGISIGGNDPHVDGGTRATVIANNTFVGDDTSNSREANSRSRTLPAATRS